MEWPILDRSVLLGTVDQALDALPRRAVLLCGPSGIGKTAVARQVAEQRATTGLQVLPAVGLEELRDVPLGALVPVLAMVAEGGLNGSGLPTAASAIATLGAIAADALLVLDDVPLLDETSAAVVYQVIRGYGMRAILTARTEHPITGPIERLLHEDLVVRVDVPALDRAELRALLRSHFGAEVRPDDVSELADLTHGNPLHLRQAVAIAEQWGRVARTQHGVEIATAGLPVDLGGSLIERIAGLDQSQRDVLALVTLGAGVAADLLLAGSLEQEALTALLRRGLVVRTIDGTVRPAHPSYGEVVLSEASDEQRRQLSLAVADRLQAASDPVLQVRGVRLRCQVDDVPPRDLEWAIRRSYASGEHRQASGFAARLIASDPAWVWDVRAAIDYASSLSAQRLLDEADAAFAVAAEVAAESADQALLISRWGAHLAFRRFDVAAALALVDDRSAGLTERDAALIEPDVHTWRILAGQVPGAPEPFELAGTGAGEPVSPEVAIRGAIAAVMLESMHGRIAEEAAEVLLRAEREHGVLDPFASDMVYLQRYFALLSQGLGAQAESVCLERRPVCTPDAVGMWSLTLGIHWQYGGRYRAARQVTELAVEQLRWRDPLGLLGFAVALLALVQVQQGETEAARATLDGLVPAQLGDPKAAMMAAEATARLDEAGGEPGRAAAQLIAAAVEAVDNGHALVAAIALGQCWRLGAAATALPILQRLRDQVGPGFGLYQALAGVAEGLVASDAAAVHRSAERLAAAGMVVAALDALAAIEPTVRRRGSAEILRKIQRTRHGLVAGTDLALPESALDDELSAREWEIAELVEQRLSSREIADRLGISVRTVDNHLANMYRKLGVRGRAELRALLGET